MIAVGFENVDPYEKGYLLNQDLCLLLSNAYVAPVI